MTFIKSMQQSVAKLSRRQHRTKSWQAELGRIQFHRAEITAPADLDAFDRSRLIRRMRPHAQRFERINAGPRQGKIALVITGLLGNLG